MVPSKTLPVLIMAIIFENENGWGHCNLFQGLHGLVVFFFSWLWALHITAKCYGFYYVPFQIPFFLIMYFTHIN